MKTFKIIFLSAAGIMMLLVTLWISQIYDDVSMTFNYFANHVRENVYLIRGLEKAIEDELAAPGPEATSKRLKCELDIIKAIKLGIEKI